MCIFSFLRIISILLVPRMIHKYGYFHRGMYYYWVENAENVSYCLWDFVFMRWLSVWICHKIGLLGKENTFLVTARLLYCHQVSLIMLTRCKYTFWKTELSCFWMIPIHHHSSLYIRLTAGTVWEVLGHSSNAAPVRIGNFMHTIKFTSQVWVGFVKIFSVNVKLKIKKSGKLKMWKMFQTIPTGHLFKYRIIMLLKCFFFLYT